MQSDASIDSRWVAQDGTGMSERMLLESPNDIIWELMNGKLKVPITEVDRAIIALEKAKIEDSSLYWILYKIVNQAERL